jgi:A/G-specific adenine glycosylase
MLVDYELIEVLDLPWRRHRTPYRILLAEMLLVRTRSDVVSRIYEEVFEHYPSIYELAEADEDELLELLRPLGLHKRVPYIIKAARYICENYDGEIPYDIQDLLAIPGVGKYTAVAEATFAYGQPLVPSDVNILRFVSRLTGLEMEHETKGSETLRNLAPLLAETRTKLSAEKLLDFTRLVCRSRQPLCEQCPLTARCAYFQVGNDGTDID